MMIGYVAHRRRLLAVLMLVIGAASAAPGAPAQQMSGRIAAVVNEDVVTFREVGERIQLAIIASGLRENEETRQRLAPQVLRGLVDERLQLQEAQRLGVSVSEEEIDEAFLSVARRNQMTPEQLSQILVSRKLGPEVVRRQLAAQIAWLKVVNRELRDRVAVTADQIDYVLQSDAAVPADEQQVRLGEILLPVYETEDEAAVENNAMEIVQAIREGADFAAMAEQLSVAPSAEMGGDLGWIPMAALVPQIRTIIDGMADGEISEPFATPAGVHIVQLRGRRSDQGTAGTQDREAVRQRLEEEQLERMANRHLRDLRRDAFIDLRI